MANDSIYVYRGVHAGHPMLEAARRGVVVPGDVHGTVTPEAHNAGGCQERSPYTSWSYSREIASQIASSDGPGFVVLRLDATKVCEDGSWAWDKSPDIYAEQEVLLRGIRIGIEVIERG